MRLVFFAWNSPEVRVVERFLFSGHTRKSKETAKSSNDVFREFNVVREEQKRRRPALRKSHVYVYLRLPAI